MSKIEIDSKSGFCFGVVNAIKKAETELLKGNTLYCLGDIVHNNLEVERLTKLGLITIDNEQFAKLKNVKVLLRAHGEPPLTYEIAKRNNIEIIDASCPVVLNLQKKIKTKYKEDNDLGAQIVIYGKIGHAEVIGLMGQTDGKAIVIEKTEDLSKLNFSRDIRLFSQTTMSLNGLQEVIDKISKQMIGDAKFDYYDTICRQVSNRIPNIKEFAQQHDIVLFVAGKKSSNGKILFEECKKYNPNSYFISSVAEIEEHMIQKSKTIGICGATSTPTWQMEQISDYVKKITEINQK